MCHCCRVSEKGVAEMCNACAVCWGYDSIRE